GRPCDRQVCRRRVRHHLPGAPRGRGTGSPGRSRPRAHPDASSTSVAATPDWHAARDAARARVEAAWDDAAGLLPQRFDAADVTPDAANLLAATGLFWKRDDPRLRRHVHGLVAGSGRARFYVAARRPTTASQGGG